MVELMIYLSGGRQDGGVEVLGADAGHLEGEPALAAHLRHRNSLPHVLDLLALLLRALWQTGNIHSITNP